MHQLLPVFLLFSIVAVWGWTFVVVKQAIDVAGVIPFLFWRFLVATLVMLPFSIPHLTKSGMKVGLGIGIALGFGYLFQTYGLNYSTPTNTGLITGMFIVFTPLINRALFGVRIPLRLWLAVSLSIAGLAMLPGDAPDDVRFGDLLTLGGAMCLGLHVALLDRYARDHHATVLAFGQMLACTCLFFFVFAVNQQPISFPPKTVWPAILLTGVIASAAGFFLQTYVQQKLSAIQTSVIIMTEPLFAVLFGYLLAGDRLTLWQFSGAGLMLVSVILAEFPIKRKTKPAEIIESGTG